MPVHKGPNQLRRDFLGEEINDIFDRLYGLPGFPGPSRQQVFALPRGIDLAQVLPIAEQSLTAPDPAAVLSYKHLN